MCRLMTQTLKVHFVEIAHFWVSFSTRLCLTNWETQLSSDTDVWVGGGLISQPKVSVFVKVGILRIGP